MIEISQITDVTKYLDGLKVVIFDLDDTLYSEKDYVRSGFKAVAEFLHNEELAQKLWDSFERKEPAIDTVLREEGIFTNDLMNQCLEVYRHHQPEISLYEGVEKMLKQIKDDGYQVGIITDGRPEGQRAKLASLELFDKIDKLLITDELGGIENRKPCKKAFERMQQFFRVPVNEMCYVGDNLRKDFIAPKKLGMKAIFFNNSDGLYYQIK